jgi:TPR repeat protein
MAYSEILLEAPEAGLTREAPAEELYRVGLIYSTGMGVSVDYLAAHKWFNLAAAMGHDEAKVCRQEMADYLSPIEIVKAQRSAREWLRQAN